MTYENDGLWRVVGAGVSGCPLADDPEMVARGLELRLQSQLEFTLERHSEGSTIRVTASFEGGAIVTWRHSRLILLNVQVEEACASSLGARECRSCGVSFVQIELAENGKIESRPMKFSDYFVTDEVEQRTIPVLVEALATG
ncbi:MAG TPA: hypothetical protein PKC31_00960 [Candidatus Nanoperiomorbaceae bacterium]|nr:hypothetical protein [Candidatus Nanoperiomorbaceae bacterium]HMQ96657.1 hypothetical protein [Candidatus Nanoperiomorbaceae bacterium]HMR86018.1 hypothetical protein [Candidatus Nanoperiomorbaceae bacterium]HMU12302.1 hypothetical protein [Candidatus Nanoperiomorbaceae bacterium]